MEESAPGKRDLAQATQARESAARQAGGSIYHSTGDRPGPRTGPHSMGDIPGLYGMIDPPGRRHGRRRPGGPNCQRVGSLPSKWLGNE